MHYPKISLITIALNSGKYIEDCICSVLGQNYPALEYIVVDGGSTDDTLDIIKKYADRISVLITEPDNGPAHALNKGCQIATGDIMGVLNTDDRLHVKSLFGVAEIFNSLEQVDWVMGYPSWFNQEGSCINEIFYERNKFYYTPDFINDNLHLKFARWSKWRFVLGDFSAIQQESVFWRKSLWDKAGGCVNVNLLAYDLELWMRFFEHSKLYTANVLLGGFRVHGNQLSEIYRNRYRQESELYIKQFKKNLLAKNFTYLLRTQAAKFVKLYYYYNIPMLKNIYPYLLDLPPHITFCHTQNKFVITQP